MKKSAKKTDVGDLLLIVAGILLLGFICLVVAYAFFVTASSIQTEKYMKSVMSRVEIGDERDQVIQELSDAWYHGTCDLAEVVHPIDTFVYGPRSVRAKVIVIFYTEKDGRLVVSRVERVQEADLRRGYRSCLPPEVIPRRLFP